MQSMINQGSERDRPGWTSDNPSRATGEVTGRRPHSAPPAIPVAANLGATPWDEKTHHTVRKYVVYIDSIPFLL